MAPFGGGYQDQGQDYHTSHKKALSQLGLLLLLLGAEDGEALLHLVLLHGGVGAPPALLVGFADHEAEDHAEYRRGQGAEGDGEAVQRLLDGGGSGLLSDIRQKDGGEGQGDGGDAHAPKAAVLLFDGGAGEVGIGNGDVALLAVGVVGTALFAHEGSFGGNILYAIAK